MSDTKFDITYKDTEFSKMQPGERFSGCIFKNCNFASCDLHEVTFTECNFIQCDFSLVQFANTSFKEVCFEDSKFTGSDFTHVNPFLLRLFFSDCIMDSVLFMDLEMNDTSFVRCNLSHADFSCATCKACLFSECNLNNARFEDSILDNSDFSTALDFVIDPMKNSIKNAIFNHQNILGLVQGLPIKIL